MIYLLLLLATILRLITINQSLWLDEAIGALAIKEFNIAGIITDFMKVDNHPPLYYIFLDLWSKVFGYSEFALRAPSVIFGIATIFFTYKIGITIFPKESKAPLFAALLLSTSQLHVYYSQEARMYSMAAFLSIIVVYLFLLILKDAKKYRLWVMFSISILFLGFTDYLPLFLLPVLWIFLFTEKMKTPFLLKMLVAHVPLIVGFIIWYPAFKVQSSNGEWLMNLLPKWTEIAGGANFKQIILLWFKFSIGRISLPSGTTARIIISIFSLPSLFLIASNYTQFPKRKFLLLWFFLPMILVLIYSFKIPAFNYFRFIFILPVFYLLIAGGTINLSKKLLPIIYFWLMLINSGSLLYYYFNKDQQREDWRSAVYEIENKIQEGEIVGFGFPEPFAPYRWYSKRPELAFGLTDSISPDSTKTKAIIDRTLGTNKGFYYFQYLNEISESEGIVGRTLENMGFSLDKTYNFTGVGFVYYYKKL